MSKSIHTINDEAAVLASLALNFDYAMKAGADVLTVNKFTSNKHQMFFETIEELNTAGIPITEVAVMDAALRKMSAPEIESILKHNPRLDKIAIHVQRVIDAKKIADLELGKVDAIRSTLWKLSQEKIPSTELNRKTATAVVEWMHRRGRFYYHKDLRDFSSVMFFDADRKLLLPVQSDAFLAWLSDALAINRAERVFSFVTAAIQDEGLSPRSTAIIPAVYWAATKEHFFLSCGAGRMAKIGPDSVTMTDNGDGALFPYGSTLAEWTYTKDGVNPFEACTLFRDMQTAAPHGKDLFQMWGISLPSDPPCKPPVCPTGPVGSGKTKVVRGVYELYGIPERITAVTKNGEADFWTAQDGGGLVCFDNADTRVDWLPDALAAAATGGSSEKRKLYSDSDRVTLRARAWTAITSACPSFASDAGLADRLLVVRLNRRTGQTAEGKLTEEITAARDAGLSWICQTLSKAMADKLPIPSGLNKRHPDFAAFAVRIGRAIGREEAFVNALRSAEMDKSRFALENDQAGALLLELITTGFEGTTAELLQLFTAADPSLDGKLSPKRLGKKLQTLWPHIEGVFNAETWKDCHTKTAKYRFSPKNAGHAVCETAFQQKSPREEEYLDFTQKRDLNTATPANEQPAEEQTVPVNTYVPDYSVEDIALELEATP